MNNNPLPGGTGHILAGSTAALAVLFSLLFGTAFSMPRGRRRRKFRQASPPHRFWASSSVSRPISLTWDRPVSDRISAWNCRRNWFSIRRRYSAPADNTSTDQTPIRLNPPLGLKLGEVTGQGEITWTVWWFNNANNGDLPVFITDPLPPDTTFIPGSLLCLPDGTSQCLSAVFNGAQNRIEVEAVLASDAGAAADSFPDQLGNEIVIEFRTQVSRSGTFLNQADAFWDENNDGSPLDEQGGGQAPVMTDDPVTTDSGDPTAVPIALEIPTLNRFGLALLILLLAGLARRRLVLAGKV